MGWLGYTEQETLATSIPVLIHAWQAVQRRMIWQAGGDPDTPSKVEPEPPRPEDIRAVLRLAASR